MLNMLNLFCFETITVSEASLKIFLDEYTFKSSKKREQDPSLWLSLPNYEERMNPQFAKVRFPKGGNPIVEDVNFEDVPVAVIGNFWRNFDHSKVTKGQITSSLPLFKPTTTTEQVKIYRSSQNFAAYLVDPSLKKRILDFAFTEKGAQKTSHLSLSINTCQFSPVSTRVNSEIFYIAEEDSIVLFGGAVGGANLPDDYTNFCCRQLMKEKADISRKRAVETVRGSRFPANDLWKFHVKENRWELILPSTCLNLLQDKESWNFDSLILFGPTCYSFMCSLQKKIYFLTPKTQIGQTARFLEYEYITNKTRWVGDFDIDDDHYSSGIRPIVDETNQTVIFLSDNLDKLLVICLKTFKYTEINIFMMLPKNKLTKGFSMMFMNSYSELAFHNRSEYTRENDGDSLAFTFQHGILDWERVRSERITPFLKELRYSLYFENEQNNSAV